MPKLQALGSNWFFASDDALVPALLGCVVTCSWNLILCYMMYIRQWDSTCFGGSNLLSFYNVILMFEIVDMVIWPGMVYISTRGTLINYWPRRNMQYLMRAKSTSQVCRLAYSVLCVKMAYYDDLTDCDDTVVRCMRYALIFNWLTTICSVLLVPNLYNPYYKAAKKTQRRRLGRRRSFIADYIVMVTKQLRRQLSNRWRRMQKYLGVAQHPGIHTAKEAIGDQFMGDLVESIAPSDVVAGFFIVNTEQKLRWQHQLNQHFSGEPNQQSHQCDDCLKPQPWMTIENVHYYYTYTKASYGWSSYALSHGVRAFWSLLRKDIGVLNQQHFLEDRFGLNTKTILASTGLQLEDLIYVSYVDKGFEVPFFVALDHKTKAIVVAIRGTMSLHDFVTDFGGLESENMDILLDGLEDDCAHEGMLLSAQCLARKLLGRNNRIQGNAKIEHVPERPILEMALDKLSTISGVDPSEYRLVIGGHSLGGSVAAVLAILLRQEPNYKDLMCFAYAPAGGLLRVPLARYCETFVCSVVLQDDFFPRMNTANIRDFRISLLQAIRNCDVPKHEIFTNVWKRTILKLFRVSRPENMTKRRNALAKPLYSSWHGDPEAERVVRHFQEEIDQAIDTIERKKEFAHPMSPPGCIIFIRELTEPCRTMPGRNNEKQTKGYASTFVRGNSELLNEVIITQHTVSHHTFTAINEALQYLKDVDDKPLLHHDCSEIELAEDTRYKYIQTG